MAHNLAQALAPVREKRAYYEQRPKLVHEIIESGCGRARGVAEKTMEEVRALIRIESRKT